MKLTKDDITVSVNDSGTGVELPNIEINGEQAYVTALPEIVEIFKTITQEEKAQEISFITDEIMTQLADYEGTPEEPGVYSSTAIAVTMALTGE